VIEIRNLKKSFNGKIVLRNIDLDIPKSQSHIIIGRSGSGKSVLLKHIIGLIRPDGGQIFVDGEEICGLTNSDLYRVRRKFGMLFQGAALFDSMTVEDNIALGVREHHMFSEPEIKKRIAERLEMIGLPGIQNMRPAELSGGMKKRVGLARALMMDPEFVLFDEPTTGLDPIMADAINDLIIYCTKQLHVTSIVVTHDMVSAYKVGDLISMLHDGEMIFTGAPDQVRRTTNPMVKQFVEGKAEGPLQIY
jgi:phospholipid/cholesterol/gamma-HCH transport system ATP-binding protein